VALLRVPDDRSGVGIRIRSVTTPAKVLAIGPMAQARFLRGTGCLNLRDLF